MIVNKALDRLFKYCFRNQLVVNGDATALARILTSRHTRDLRFIGLLALFTIIALALLYVGSAYLWTQQTELERKASAMGADFFKLLGLGALSGVLSWAYQTGSQRLGTVDLFACEVSALCRVALIVDFAKSSTSRAQRRDRPEQLAGTTVDPGQGPERRRFVSEEKYTPVYDTNLKALDALDVGTVSRVTEFYTYRKTMMDYLRRAATLDPDTREWWHAMTGMIYMQYLMYEAARHAVKHLIEFDPDREESIVNILCSEIVLYAFLIRCCQGDGTDYRFERLKLRRSEYAVEYGAILKRVQDHPYPTWNRARTTARELSRRYDEAFEVCPSHLDPVAPSSLAKAELTPV
ncbi:MAG: hypothetical protein NVSMB18_03910 [Acetobacteraceae bacterium]